MEQKILIIEDESELREAASEALRTAGFTVITAEDGQLGIEKAEQEQPDLILLDLRMPVMNGLEMLSKMRSTDWGADIKVIVLTVDNSLESASQAQQNNLLHYLVKVDTSLDDLVAKVTEALT